jgi:hypothetical protein
MRKCPHCYELIEDNAVKCGFCGEQIKQHSPSLSDNNAKRVDSEEPWPLLSEDVETPETESETNKKLARKYDLFKARSYGWAWIFLVYVFHGLAKSTNFQISLYFSYLTVPFYFWLRWKIIKRMTGKGTYGNRKWVPPLIAISVSYVLIALILFLGAIFDSL